MDDASLVGVASGGDASGGDASMCDDFVYDTSVDNALVDDEQYSGTSRDIYLLRPLVLSAFSNLLYV